MRCLLPLLCVALSAAVAPVVAGAEAYRPLTVALAVNAGIQYDARPCTLAGREGVRPDVPICLLFAGGTDLALLWRGRLGGAVGLYSSAGQAVKTGQAAAIPDRVSVPLLLELRPLGFLGLAAEESLRGRLLGGLALRAGPSLELVRTSSDSSAGVGFHTAVLGEVPLTAARRHGISLRLQFHVIAAPWRSLNEGAVRSSPSSVCMSMTDCPATERSRGYDVVVQTYAGFVYYP